MIYRAATIAPFFFFAFSATFSFFIYRIYNRILQATESERQKGSLYESFAIMVCSFVGLLAHVYFNFVLGLMLFLAFFLFLFGAKKLFDSDRADWSE